MKVTAGERSITIGLTYSEARGLATHLDIGGAKEAQEKIRAAIVKGTAKGYPRPPLPKGNPDWPVIVRAEDPKPCEACRGSGESPREPQSP